MGRITVKKVSKLTLIILMIGIALVGYYLPDLNQHYSGLSRYSPIRGFILGLVCIGFAIYDFVNKYIKTKK